MVDADAPYLQLMTALADLDVLATTVGADAILAAIPVANPDDPEEIQDLRAFLQNSLDLLGQLRERLEAGQWAPAGWPETPAQE